MRARAARARNHTDIPISKKPISKKPGQNAKKPRKARTARKQTQPLVAAVAANLSSEGEDSVLGGGDVEGDDVQAEPADIVQEMDGREMSAELDPASPASARPLPVGASGEAAGAGPPTPDPASRRLPDWTQPLRRLPDPYRLGRRGKQQGLGRRWRKLLGVRGSTNHLSKFGSG